MGKSNAFSLTLALLVEQVARELVQSDPANRLPLGQWAILRYLKTAGQAGRAIAPAGRQLGVTSGQLRLGIIALVRKGLVVELKAVEGAGRLALTGKAIDLLKRDPVEKVARAAAALPAAEQARLVRSLKTILTQLQADRSEAP